MLSNINSIMNGVVGKVEELGGNWSVYGLDSTICPCDKIRLTYDRCFAFDLMGITSLGSCGRLYICTKFTGFSALSLHVRDEGFSAVPLRFPEQATEKKSKANNGKALKLWKHQIMAISSLETKNILYTSHFTPSFVIKMWLTIVLLPSDYKPFVEDDNILSVHLIEIFLCINTQIPVNNRQ